MQQLSHTFKVYAFGEEQLPMYSLGQRTLSSAHELQPIKIM